MFPRIVEPARGMPAMKWMVFRSTGMQPTRARSGCKERAASKDSPEVRPVVAVVAVAGVGDVSADGRVVATQLVGQHPFDVAVGVQPMASLYEVADLDQLRVEPRAQRVVAVE